MIQKVRLSNMTELKSTLTIALDSLSECDSSDGKEHILRVAESSEDNSPYLTVTYTNGYYSIVGTGVASERWSTCPAEDRIRFLAKFKIGVICPMF